MRNFVNQDDEEIFDMKPNEGEEEYRIVGANFRKLSPSDTGESGSFWIIAEPIIHEINMPSVSKTTITNMQAISAKRIIDFGMNC